MSTITGCVFCRDGNPMREKDGKIRCERFHEWRKPTGDACKEFFDRQAAETLQRIGELKK